MATWRNNDREESKPSWLNKAQKRNCVRTVRGWEVPASNTYGNQFDGWKLQGPTAFIPNTELIVAMPTDKTGGDISTGDMVGPIFFVRGFSGAYGDGYGGGPSGPGFTSASGRDVPNYTPYFTCPFNGDSCTQGGPNSTGVTHSGSNGSGLTYGQNYAYKVNKYGVSSLGLPLGVTAYIKVCANDFNYTQNITFSTSNTGCNLYTGSELLDATKVPLNVYEEFFGPTSSVNNNIAVIRFTDKQTITANSVSAAKFNVGMTGSYLVIGLTAADNSGVAGGGFTSGATSHGVRFTVTFDRL